VFSGGPQDIPIDLDRALYLGEERYNPPLYAGYTIYVPARSDRVVNVVGEVNVPREVEWVEGDSLTMLLKLAGGLLTEAAGDQIRVIRGAEAFDASQVIPMAGDIIDVPLNTALSETHSVVIYGAVRNPGHYDYRDGETPAQLTARAGGLANEAAPQRKTVFRLAVNDEYGRSSKVRYPIESPVGGGYKAAGLMLNPGDSVFVPSLIGYVKVSGEVRNPGLYPYEEDLAAASYIDIAGGMLPTADRTLVDIFQRVSRITGTYPTGVTVHDGDEVIVRRREELQ
jgi:protein involved in polysaccharide export with SLBB domain